MKKRISIILCIVLSLTLFGCDTKLDSIVDNIKTHLQGEESGGASATADGPSAGTQDTGAEETGAASASESEKPSDTQSPAESQPMQSSDSQSPAESQPTQSSDSQSPAESQPTPTPTPSEQPHEDEGAGLWKTAELPFSFTATDLYGNAVTEKSLGNKQLFFIHYWATWCGPCLQEMPELAQIASDFCDSVGFIALLDDYDSNLSGAQRIVESAGIPQSFIMVDASQREVSGLMRLVQSGYLPTTAIIDCDGNMVAEQLIGAYGDVYAVVLEYLLTNGPG